MLRLSEDTAITLRFDRTLSSGLSDYPPVVHLRQWTMIPKNGRLIHRAEYNSAKFGADVKGLRASLGGIIEEPEACELRIRLIFTFPKLSTYITTRLSAPAFDAYIAAADPNHETAPTSSSLTARCARCGKLLRMATEGTPVQ